MANLIYLKLTGELQGLISAGCSSVDSIGNKAQLIHYDQIMVMGLTHGITRVQNVNHQAVVMIKPLDKSSPLLGKAISENESLTCEFSFYRTTRAGMNECYYKVKLTKAHIAAIQLRVPHTLNDSEGQAEETLELSYESITWEHCTAGTSAYSLWHERVF